MQIIWHEDKALVFKSGDSEGDVPCVRIGDESGLNPANLLQKFDNNNILYVLSDDPGRTFEHFLGHTTLVEAAGGTVEDGEGRMLMMLRRGRWDLPKGPARSGRRDGTATGEHRGTADHDATLLPHARPLGNQAYPVVQTALRRRHDHRTADRRGDHGDPMDAGTRAVAKSGRQLRHDKGGIRSLPAKRMIPGGGPSGDAERTATTKRTTNIQRK